MPKHTHTREETWKPVVGHEGNYEISDFGNVRSMDRTITTKTGVRKRRRGQPIKWAYVRGYPSVNIQGSKYVHRLVLEAFVGPCPEGMEACHENGDRNDPRLSNLRWDTSSANNHDIVRHGRHWHAQKVKCPRGHILEAPNLLKNKVSGRECLACSRAKSIARNSGRADIDLQELSDEKYRELLKDSKSGRTSRQNKHKTHCPRGHLLEMPNLVMGKFNKYGYRECLSCNRAGNSLRSLGIRSDAKLQEMSDSKYEMIMGDGL